MRELVRAIGVPTLLGLAVSAACAQDAPPTARIAPGVQAARDAERLAILAEELAREQARLAAAAQQRGAALAARDAPGAQAAEAAVARATDNVGALEREIERARRAGADSAPAAPPVAPRRAPRAAPASAPWWDVYGRAAPQANAGSGASTAGTDRPDRGY